MVVLHRLTSVVVASSILLNAAPAFAQVDLGIFSETNSETSASVSSSANANGTVGVSVDASIDSKIANRCKRFVGAEHEECVRRTNMQMDARGEGRLNGDMRALHGKFMRRHRDESYPVKDVVRDVQAWFEKLCKNIRHEVVSAAREGLKECKDKESAEREACANNVRVKAKADLRTKVEAWLAGIGQ